MVQEAERRPRRTLLCNDFVSVLQAVINELTQATKASKTKHVLLLYRHTHTYTFTQR